MMLWVIAGLLVLFYIGGGWYLSELLRAGGFVVKPHQREYRATVGGIEGIEGAETISHGELADAERIKSGLLGLVWQGGYGTIDHIIDISSTEATGDFVLLGGDPPTVGTKVDVDLWVAPDQYGSLFSSPIEAIVYQSPLGEMDADLIPGSSDTWAILVHGKNANRRETVRLGLDLSNAGYPMLAITHRNDRDQPADPSGFHRYGVTEWEDLEGAVQYALDNGADRVVLGGLSTGGAVILSFLEKSRLSDRVAGVVLDSPNIDFGATVAYNASQRKLPLVWLKITSSLTWVGKAIASIRFGVHWHDIAYASRAESLQAPVLVIHGTEDPAVPVTTSRQFAAARPDGNPGGIRRGKACSVLESRSGPLSE
jgi:pimeloyl-ACP methyl ester carboxylesterase